MLLLQTDSKSHAGTQAEKVLTDSVSCMVHVMCRWSNARSEGKLMSFDLVDKDGGEIKATAWNDQVDMFQDLIQVCTQLQHDPPVYCSAPICNCSVSC